ncbi:hypothetical protein GCM10023314_27560 [Algibacter agarivorans]|uniref:HYR domain-containing protein n=2 Tax=Algibacter agarivorans TaxID=1109741 RepID=A0ABP9GSW5_9FLAO
MCHLIVIIIYSFVKKFKIVMMKKRNLFKSIFILLVSVSICLTSCSKDDAKEEEVKDPVDTTDPTITCEADVTVNVDVFSSGTVVTYNTPVGTDNLSGAVTTQTEGKASGASFPIGTTKNTFEVKDAAGNTTSCSFNVIVVKNAPSEVMPYLVEVDITPAGKEWAKVTNLSDEFDGTSLNATKWKNTDANRWVGRAPGIFKANTVSVADGDLKLTAYKLAAPEVVNGNTFTHAGSNIYSKNAAQVGQYFECRMKANKTFMSSTFWLINNRNDGSGCDKRVTELDIQECVGQVTGTSGFAQKFDESIHSNTHSRQADCPETPVGSAGGDAPTDGKVWADYHVYAAWWKSPNEIIFYLDGKRVYSITPKGVFDLPSYLRMVVETYDWNPVPADGGMRGTAAERTTYYDWVRTWELKDK